VEQYKQGLMQNLGCKCFFGIFGAHAMRLVAMRIIFRIKFYVIIF